MTAALSDNDKYFTGSVGIKDGVIAFASPDPAVAGNFAKENSGGERPFITIDGTGKVAMPGLINLHNHVSMALMRSYADDMALMPWLTEKIWPFEAKLTRDDIYLGARLGIAEMLLGGTTTFVDMYWETDMIAKAVVESGIRGVVSASFIDGKIEKSVADTLRVIEKYHSKHGDLLEIRLAPHAPFTCSPETIAKVIELAKEYSLNIQVHLSETREENETVKQRYGKTPAEYLRDNGLFDLPTLAAHCVHVTEGDMDIMAEYNVAVAHNPQSNMKLASGIAPVKRMLEKGITVGIGTDGPSSNNDLDMWEELRMASFLQKVANYDPCVLPAYEILLMATAYGAKALGKEGKLGVLQPGAYGDVILIDTGKPHLQPANDVISNLAYCAKASDVDTVIVGGKILVEKGELKGAGLKGLYDKTNARVAELKSL